MKEKIMALLELCNDEKKLLQVFTILYKWKEAHC